VRIIVEVLVENRDTPRLHQVLFEEAPAGLDPHGPATHRDGRDHVRARRRHGRRRPSAGGTGAAERIAVVTVESLVHRLVATPTVAELDLDRFQDETVRLLVAYLRPPAG
jgi:hypothetical protein